MHTDVTQPAVALPRPASAGAHPAALAAAAERAATTKRKRRAEFLALLLVLLGTVACVTFAPRTALVRVALLGSVALTIVYTCTGLADDSRTD